MYLFLEEVLIDDKTSFLFRNAERDTGQNIMYYFRAEYRLSEKGGLLNT